MARLYFQCDTNSYTPYINIAIFIKDGREYEIDRDTTEYGSPEMVWRGVYIWDGESEHYFDEDSAEEFFRDAEFKEFELEDDPDVPEDYYCNCIDWGF